MSIGKNMVTTPTNKNFLGQAGFKLVIDRIPHVTYFCQSAPLPAIQLSSLDRPTPLVNYPIPGSKVQFSSFNITFRVDEDMKNFIEIFNWITGIAPTTDSNQRSTFLATTKNNNVLSDGTLLIYSSKYNPNLTIKFRDLFPESLSQLQFTTQGSDVDYLEADVSFRYSSFSIESFS